MIPLPILLIHGFNGQPANWTDAEDRFPDFLAQQGYDPELIRLFSYGFVESNGKTVYNTAGDLREIAHRLDESDSADAETRAASVDQLSRDSVARGGPTQITIIAHSSGGLIARYYLSCGSEDEYHTRYRGQVARLIMLGTPHHGVTVENLTDLLPAPLVFSVVARMHPALPRANVSEILAMREDLQNIQQAARQDWFADKAGDLPAFKQLHPGSDFVRALNRPGAMPRAVDYHNIIGDIRVGVSVHLARRRVLYRETSLGDGLVSAFSASDIPNAAAQSGSITERHELDVAIGGGELIRARVALSGDQPTPIHRHLRSHPKAREKILEILLTTAK